MKIKHILIVSLVLAILTIGAVSASEDLSCDVLAADDGGGDSLMVEEDSSSDDGEDFGEDEWEENYPDDDYPIYINDEVAINDESDYFAEVELDSEATGNISISVDGNKILNKKLEELNRQHPYDEDDEMIIESLYVYDFYLNDFSNIFEEGNTYAVKVSYFDGTNTYSSTEDITVYKKDLVSREGITVEVLSGDKCYIDYENSFIEITAPESADGNVTVIISDKNGVKYSRTLKLSEIDEYSEDDGTIIYQILPTDIDSDFETGTYDVNVTYNQEGIDAINIIGRVTFTTEYEEENLYKGQFNSNEVSLNDNETVLISVYCPEGTLGKFVINFMDDEWMTLRSVVYEITADDYGKTITWNISSLNITEAGKYSVEVYHYADEENRDYIGDSTLNIVEDSQFRVKGSEAYLSYTDAIFFVYCPAGSEGKKLTLVATEYDDYEALNQHDYTIKSEDTGKYIGFTFDELGIHTEGYYWIYILLDDESLSDLVSEFHAKSFIGESTSVKIEEDEIAYVILQPGAEGRIILEIDNRTYFNKSLTEFSDENIDDDFNEAVTYKIYCEDLDESITPGTYDVKVTFIGAKTISESFESTFYHDNTVKDDETGIEMEILRDSYYFVDVYVPYSIHEGNISIIIDGVKRINIDLATYEDYEWDDSGYNIYRFEKDDLNPPVTGTAHVKVIYINGEKVISTEDDLEFSKVYDSELTFNETELIFDEGTDGKVTFTVNGAYVEEENIIIEEDSSAVISLIDDEITISGLSAGTYTLKVTTTPYEDYRAITKTLNITVREKTLINPSLELIIENVEEGNPVTITVKTNSSFTGEVKVVSDNFDDVTVNVVDGEGSTTITLGAGEYSAKAIFEKTDVFNASEVTKDFNVTAKPVGPYAADLKVIVDNADLGDNVTIYITINNLADGIVTVKVIEEAQSSLIVLPGEESTTYDKTFEIEIKDGKGNKTITDLTNSGKYNFVANYTGNTDVLSDEVTGSFNILEDANLTISFNDIEVGEDFIVNISMKYKGLGFDTVSVETIPTTSPQPTILLNQGKGKVNITDLALGKYTIKVTFNGNDYFKAAVIEDTFIVTPQYQDADLDVNVDNITVGDNATVEIKFNESVTGDVYVTINRQTLSKSFAQALEGNPKEWNFTFTNLPVGTHNVVVNFTGTPVNSLGDKFFRPIVKTATVKVKPIQVSANLTVKADEIYVGQDATVTVSLNQSATGAVTINIDGDKLIEIENGTGKYIISDLGVGTHTFTVTFAGDEYFLSDTKDVTVNVKEYDARIEIIKAENEFNNGNFLFKVINNTNNAPINNVSVSLTSLGKVSVVFTGVTDENGIVSFKTSVLYVFFGDIFNITLLPLEVGKHPFTVEITNKSITSQKIETNLTITPAHIKITVSPYEEYYGSEKYLIINVTNINGEILPNAVFKLNVPDINPEAFYGSSDENGTIKVSVKQVYKGTHEIIISNNDTNIVDITEKANFTIKALDAEFNATASDVYVGENATIEVTANENFNGTVLIKINGQDTLFKVENGTLKINLGTLEAGVYTYNLTYFADLRYSEGTQPVSFKVNRKSISFNIEIANVEEGTPITVKVTSDKAFTGDVLVKIAENYITVAMTNGEGTNTGLTLPVDTYKATLDFAQTGEFNATYAETSFNVTVKSVVPVDPNLELIIANVEEGTPVTVVVKTNATFTGTVTIASDVFNGTISVVSGEGSKNITLPVGEYSFKAIFKATELFNASEKTAKFNVTAKSNSGSNGSANTTPSGNETNNTVPAKITAKDLTAYYTAEKYSVTVYGTDGNLAPKGTQVIFKINGKQVGTAKTNAKGVATIKLNQVPGNYKITAEALGANITKKLTVKHIVTLKKVKVKKSAKKLVIKVTVKVGKKAVSKKKVTLKFNGKKFKAKTNKKGVAKFTIKKKVLKKLKKGKKVTYQATYLKDTVKRTVKVKK